MHTSKTPPPVYLHLLMSLGCGGSECKESACNVGDMSSIPGLGRSSGEGHGNPLHEVFLPGESPWTEEPGGLQSMGLQGVGHDQATNTFHTKASII